MRVVLFGGVSLEGDGFVLHNFGTKKQALLLAYLALNLGTPVSRDLLVSLLWPEADQYAGRNSLSVALSRLRKVLGLSEDSDLRADRWTIELCGHDVSCDVHEFEKHACEPCSEAKRRVEACSRAMQLYRGPLMPGEQEPWAVGERMRLEKVYQDVVFEALTLAPEVGDTDGTLDRAAGAISHLGHKPEFHQAVVRAYQLAGRKEDAERYLRSSQAIVQTRPADDE